MYLVFQQRSYAHRLLLAVSIKGIECIQVPGLAEWDKRSDNGQTFWDGHGMKHEQ
jgi:hypothetical protein